MDESKKISLTVPERAYKRLKQEASDLNIPVSLIVGLLIQEHASALASGKKYHYIKDEIRPRLRNLERENELLSLAKELGVEVKPLPVPAHEFSEVDEIEELKELVHYE